MFGEVAGDAFATAVTLTDSIVVVGGGLTGAVKYIKPALLAEMRSTLKTMSDETVQRVQMRVFDLDASLNLPNSLSATRTRLPSTERKARLCTTR